MSQSVAPAPEAVPFLKSAVSAAYVAFVVGPIAVLVGVIVGVRTMARTEGGAFGDTHPFLGIGVAVLVLSVVVGTVSGLFGWVCHAYAAPRLAAHEAELKRERDRIDATSW